MKPHRILHVLWDVQHAGGVEQWLLRVLEHADRKRFHHDLMVLTPGGGHLVGEFEGLGARVFFTEAKPRPTPRFTSRLAKLLAENGPYQIVHSHVHYFSGCVLQVAQQAGVPIRIVQSHADLSQHRSEAGIARRLYWNLMTDQTRRHANLGLAVSRQAAQDLFGVAWESDRRWNLHPSAIDLRPFAGEVDNIEVREELGLPRDALVIGHVGRFMPEKCHGLLVRIFAEIRRNVNSRLLLVGDGPTRSAVERQVDRLGLTESVVFTGTHPNVARLMKGAMDVFVFPSSREGLGLVALEAQAAGLPVVMSDRVPDEAACVAELVRRVSHAQPVDVWADVICKFVRSTPGVADHALQTLSRSPFNIENNVRHLEDIYSRALGEVAVARVA